MGNQSDMGNIGNGVSNVFELPFPEGSFDAVFAHTLLRHLNQPLGGL
jgi:ubiquinone/menaquinone biosynthesis C-methylase UbiE